jgi:hypothetical protein
MLALRAYAEAFDTIGCQTARSFTRTAQADALWRPALWRKSRWATSAGKYSHRSAHSHRISAIWNVMETAPSASQPNPMRTELHVYAMPRRSIA